MAQTTQPRYLRTAQVAELLHVSPRRSAAGPRRACCPTSAPWAATDATPTGRSGPCGKPCPSHPRPASPRVSPPGPAITVVHGFGGRSGIVLRSIGIVSDRDTGDSVRARANRPLALAWRARSRRAAEPGQLRAMAARCCPGVPVGHGPVAARPVQPATDQQLVDEMALSPQDDRRPWSAPTAT